MQVVNMAERLLHIGTTHVKTIDVAVPSNQYVSVATNNRYAIVAGTKQESVVTVVETEVIMIMVVKTIMPKAATTVMGDVMGAVEDSLVDIEIEAAAAETLIM